MEEDKGKEFVGKIWIEGEEDGAMQEDRRKGERRQGPIRSSLRDRRKYPRSKAGHPLVPKSEFEET